MRAAIVVSVVVVSVVSTVGTGCLSERTYLDPNASLPYEWRAATAAVLGDVGELTGFDNTDDGMGMERYENRTTFSGNVPYQKRDSSSVFLDVKIVNGHLLPVGEELRQDERVDVDDPDLDRPALDVYVCPNGEGTSGNAEDIVVKKTGPEDYEFHAVGERPGQNLNVDLAFAPLPD